MHFPSHPSLAPIPTTASPPNLNNTVFFHIENLLFYIILVDFFNLFVFGFKSYNTYI